jgi:hypothetical protein
MRPLPATPVLRLCLMRTRYSLPLPHLGRRYLHHTCLMVAARSLHLHTCFPWLILTPCAGSLATALDLCRARARYPSLPCLLPATYSFSVCLLPMLSIPAGHALVVHRPQALVLSPPMRVLHACLGRVRGSFFFCLCYSSPCCMSPKYISSR